MEELNSDPYITRHLLKNALEWINFSVWKMVCSYSCDGRNSDSYIIRRLLKNTLEC